MAICTSCGNNLSADDMFCTNCGKPVNASSDKVQGIVQNIPASSPTHGTLPAGMKPATQTSSVEFQPSGKWYARAYDINKNQVLYNPQMGDLPLIYDFSPTSCSSFMTMNFAGGGKGEVPSNTGSWSYDPVSRILKFGPGKPGMLVYTMVSQIEDKFLFKWQNGYTLFSRT
jgi:hypothetical protein